MIRQRHVDNDQDPEVSTTSELFALANGLSWTPISVNSCVVDGSAQLTRCVECNTRCMMAPVEDDDVLMMKTAIPLDFASSDVERPHHVDDDGVEKDFLVKKKIDVVSHGDDGGGEDRPPSPRVPTDCGGCFINRGKRSPFGRQGDEGKGWNTRDKDPKPFAKGFSRS
ncbi:hypothetical protein Tco_0419086 [Tanacetum coccineum]